MPKIMSTNYMPLDETVVESILEKTEYKPCPPCAEPSTLIKTSDSLPKENQNIIGFFLFPSPKIVGRVYMTAECWWVSEDAEVRWYTKTPQLGVYVCAKPDYWLGFTLPKEIKDAIETHEKERI